MMLKAGFVFKRMRRDCGRPIPGLVGRGEGCRIPNLPYAQGAGPFGSLFPLVSSHELSLTG